jgi:hypothetical protein
MISAIIIIGLMIAFVFCLLSATYISSLNNETSKILKQSKSLSSINITENKYNEIDAVLKGLKKSDDEMAGANFVYGHELISAIFPNIVMDTEPLINDYILTVNGVQYFGKNDNSYVFPSEKWGNAKSNMVGMDLSVRVIFDVIGTVDLPIWTGNAEIEFRGKFPRDDIVVAGKPLESPGEVMISEYLLSKFGISDRQISELIGTPISLLVSVGDRDYEILENYILAGVIAENFYRIESWRDGGHVIVYPKENADWMLTGYFITIDSDSFENIYTMAEYLRNYGINEFYYNDIVDIFIELERQKAVIGFILLMIGIALLITVVFCIYNILAFHADKRAFYFGVLNAMGLSKKKMWLFLCTQLQMLMAIAVILSLFITMIIAYSVSSYLEEALYVQVYYGMGEFIIRGAVLFAATPVLSIMMSQLIIKKTFKKELIAILKME